MSIREVLKILTTSIINIIIPMGEIIFTKENPKELVIKICLSKEQLQNEGEEHANLFKRL